MRGINSGFEDREGHQAPFTLLKEENAQRPTANAQRLKAEKECAIDRLFGRLDRFDDRVEIGPFARFEFGMKEFSIGPNFERAALRWNEGERRDSFAEFENLGRQTDGLRRVVSNHAIFDGYFRLHLALLS